MVPEESTVAVVGGAGYIGCHLVAQLLEEGFYVKVFDAFFFGEDVLAFAKSPKLSVITGDICDAREVSSFIQGCDAVIFLAAHTGHRTTDESWTNIRNPNFFAATTVLDASLEHGIDRFLFASTNSVYGVQSGVMYETSDPAPVSLYSRLKLRMEERVLRRKRSYFHPTVLRVATCHGLSPRMRFDLVTNSMIRDAVTKGVVRIAEGEQWRSQIHVIDAARAFVSCLKAHHNLISGETFNVGTQNQNIQISQVAKAIIDILPETELEYFNSDQDLTDYRLSCSKLEKIIDFEAQYSIRDSILEISSALKNNEFGDPYSLKYGSNHHTKPS